MKRLITMALVASVTAPSASSESQLAETESIQTAESIAETVSDAAPAEQTAEQIKAVAPKEGDVTDQIYVTKDIMFTSSTPLELAKISAYKNGTGWKQPELPNSSFTIQTVDQAKYESMKPTGSRSLSIMMPEGIYEYELMGAGFYTETENGEYLYIRATWNGLNADEYGHRENWYKTYEIFLQLVDDLLKSGNTKASEMSDITIVQVGDDKMPEYRLSVFNYLSEKPE